MNTTVKTPEVRALLETLMGMEEVVDTIFRSGDEAEILRLGKFLKGTKDILNKRIGQHDALVDRVHDGSYGKDYLPKVKRIYEPRGRKAEVRQTVSLVDSLLGD